MAGRAGRGLVLAVGLVVLLVATAAGLGAAAVLQRRPAVYHSQAVLLIDQEPALTASGDDGILNKLTRLRVKYVDIVHTTVFADELGARLGLPSSRVYAAVGATAPLSSLLLTVTADDGDPTGAQRIAQGAATLLREQLSAQQTGIGIKAGQLVTFTVVTPATTGTKTSPAARRTVLVGAVVFGAVLAGGLVLLDVLRRRRD
ncbi:MAG: hypothetical protein JWM02_2240 [Frankiales bacterium]|nr:hypothetical protein [Frankiales bacterium]